MIISNTELASITGGGISATLLNAISRTVTTLYGIGVAIGSSIRRLFGGATCKI